MKPHLHLYFVVLGLHASNITNEYLLSADLLAFNVQFCTLKRFDLLLNLVFSDKIFLQIIGKA